MHRRVWSFTLLLIILVSCHRHEPKKGLLVRSGDYLGQILPSDQPMVFAGGIISTGMDERDISITADGNEIYYSLSSCGWSTIMVARRIKGIWYEPVVAEFARDTNRYYSSPGISHDGRRILFSSSQPGDTNQQIWMAERDRGRIWGIPFLLPSLINKPGSAFHPSLAKNGNLYFLRRNPQTQRTSIYLSKWENNKFLQPEPLPHPINGNRVIFNAGIAPDESFLVASVGEENSKGTPESSTYMVFFHNPDGSWSKGIDMIKVLRWPCKKAISISVSPDGTYIFYAADERTLSYRNFYPGWELTNFHRMRNLEGNGTSDIYWLNFRKVMFRL
ncbi:MAG: hypothetical protein WCR01_08105 [Bacteroidota bacterium]